MADRQNRVGSKIGGAGVAGASESNVDRRERLRKLALETIGKQGNSFIGTDISLFQALRMDLKLEPIN